MTSRHTTRRPTRRGRSQRTRFAIKLLVALVVTLAGVYLTAVAVEDSVSNAPAQTGAEQTGSAPALPPTLDGAQQDPAGPPATEPQDPARPPFDSTAASAELATIPVKGRAPKTGYGRESQFGDPWFDLDRNGCKTRNDILARDLEVTELAADGCVVLAGSFTDPYTGTHIDFEHGERTSPLVQIDHVVALSDAWQKGAQLITPKQRLALANDPLNLLAVDGPTNSSKGDSDAASWLPPNRAFRCEYVARQVAVKAEYALWVTEAERDAMARVLAECAA